MLLEPTIATLPQAAQAPSPIQNLLEELRFAEERYHALERQAKAEDKHITSIEKQLRKLGLKHLAAGEEVRYAGMVLRRDERGVSLVTD